MIKDWEAENTFPLVRVAWELLVCVGAIRNNLAKITASAVLIQKLHVL